MPLAIVQLKNTPNLPVSPFHQIFRRLPSGHPVVQRNMGYGKLRVKAVNKNNGNPLLLQFFIQRKVRIGQTAFCRFHNGPRYAVSVQDIRQNRFVPAKPVVGKSNLDGITLFKQYLFDSLNRFRKYIAVYISSHHGDPCLILQVFLPYIADICAASPLPHENAFLLQNADGVADRLSAYMKHFLQSVF